MADTSGRWSELPLDEVPPRFTFVPGTDRNAFKLIWREAEPYDIPQLQRIVRHAGWRASSKLIDKYLRYTGWTIRVALRNKNTVVAMYAGRYHSIDTANVLSCVWVHPDFLDTVVPVRLLQLARLELPEKPTLAYVSAADEAMRAKMVERGWTDITDDNESKRRLFAVRSVGGPEYRAALGASGSVRNAPQKHQQG